MNATTIRETIARMVREGKLVKCKGCGRYIAPVAACEHCQRMQVLARKVPRDTPERT